MTDSVKLAIEETFSGLQKLAEACLCVAAAGFCYGINELFYYWPIMQSNFAG